MKYWNLTVSRNGYSSLQSPLSSDESMGLLGYRGGLNRLFEHAILWAWKQGSNHLVDDLTPQQHLPC